MKRNQKMSAKTSGFLVAGLILSFSTAPSFAVKEFVGCCNGDLRDSGYLSP